MVELKLSGLEKNHKKRRKKKTRKKLALISKAEFFFRPFTASQIMKVPMNYLHVSLCIKATPPLWQDGFDHPVGI